MPPLPQSTGCNRRIHLRRRPWWCGRPRPGRPGPGRSASRRRPGGQPQPVPDAQADPLVPPAAHRRRRARGVGQPLVASAEHQRLDELADDHRVVETPERMVIDVRRQQREELLAQRVKDARWDGRHERSTLTERWHLRERGPPACPRPSTTPDAPITPIGERPKVHRSPASSLYRRKHPPDQRLGVG